jgi:tetratricopeptide (TPR) repeat protein
MPTVSQLTSDPAFETNLFWNQYKAPIIAVAAVLLLGGLGYAGYKLYTARQVTASAAMLANAKSAQDYQAVIDRYPESEAAASAYLLLAEQQRAEKKYAEANATLHKFLVQFPEHELVTSAWMGIAANLESLGKSDEAQATYKKVATEYPQSFNAPLALLAQVPALKAKNQFEEVRRICETILSQYRDSATMNEALREMMALPKPATPPMPAAAPPSPTEPAIPMARPPENPAPAASATP